METKIYEDGKCGWCGNSDLYYKVEEGCQSVFGECHGNSITSTTKKIVNPNLMNIKGENTSISEKENCTERFDNDDLSDLKEMTDALDITLCEAVDLYNYIEQNELNLQNIMEIIFDNDFIEDECYNECTIIN
ncbi:hypothetical protein PIROE2DRAFT_1878 [Piromyces sp. E2]|nr:hypothetical protein PIROE2DRAFT_1878 [Piromyces sp. E2]|eukprot:OUM70177.1 hypothetical protein PIROE2DRAFT_1878 [Piromyces sp. E2]